MNSEVLTEVVELLYGGGAHELISKMNPTQSDLATKKRQRTQAQVGLASNVVGLGAGVAGTAAALRDDRFAAKKSPKPLKALHRASAKIPSPISGKAGKAGALLAGGALGLQVANIGGDVVANRVLARSAKKDKKGFLVKKDLGDLLNNTTTPTKGHLTRAAVTSPKARKKGTEFAQKARGKLLPAKVTTTNKVEKSAGAPSDEESFDFGRYLTDEVDVLWEGEIAKADADKQQIFGWASVVEVNGNPVVDLQGDHISTDEMEKAGYEYVMKSRKGGDMHLRDDWSPIQKSEMIESFIVTPEKRDAMGLPDSVPSGWWVGFQVQDPEVWSKVKNGERTGFSIHGHGKRTPQED